MAGKKRNMFFLIMFLGCPKMFKGDPELSMLSLPVWCQSARTHRKSELNKKDVQRTRR